MKKSLQQNKKGVSEIVSYILLIVGALGLSILVYSYLKDFTPKGQTDCEEDVSLSIRDYVCNSDQKNLTIVLYNNGKFNIPDFYVKIGRSGSSVRCAINDIRGGLAFRPGRLNVFSYNPKSKDIPNCDFVFFLQDKTYILEIQPVVADKKSRKWAVCENAIISQEITCKPA
jgi:hypothetical protein